MSLAARILVMLLVNIIGFFIVYEVGLDAQSAGYGCVLGNIMMAIMTIGDDN